MINDFSFIGDSRIYLHSTIIPTFMIMNFILRYLIKISYFIEYLFSLALTRSSFLLPSLDDNLETICKTLVLIKSISLDPNTTMGADGIGPKILSQRALALYTLFHIISFVSFWYSGGKADLFHNPIFKSGDKLKVSNYKPITLLHLVSKVIKQRNPLILWRNQSHYVNLDFELHPLPCNNV